MRPLFALIKREFAAYFLSPVAYVTIAVFLAVTGWTFHEKVLLALTTPGSAGIEYPFQAWFGEREFWLVFLFIPPLLTMRLLAEERGTGTLETLLTSPIRDWQVVAGKYIGALMFYVVLWLPTLIYLPILTDLDTGPLAWNNWKIAASWSGIHFGIDPWPVLTSYLGVMLAGAMFLAIGLLVSSLVKSQLISAMIAMVVGLIFVLAAFLRPEGDSGSFFSRFVYFFSVPEHFRRDFTRGILDTRPLILYVTVTLTCLFLTVRSLEFRRLRA
jgi:ABC-type transport system involved in multi-copper enzyme maturation permease subunit